MSEAQKRFILFGGECYYANGGANDYIDSFATKQDAIRFGETRINKYSVDWHHVFDLVELKIVAKSDVEPHQSG